MGMNLIAGSQALDTTRAIGMEQSVLAQRKQQMEMQALALEQARQQAAQQRDVQQAAGTALAGMAGQPPAPPGQPQPNAGPSPATWQAFGGQPQPSPAPPPGQASVPNGPPAPPQGAGGPMPPPMGQAPQQGAPMQPQQPPGPPPIPPYQSRDQAMQRGQPPQQAPFAPGMAPPPVGAQPPQQAPTGQDVAAKVFSVPAVLAQLKSQGVPEHLWLPTLESMKPIMDMQGQQQLRDLKAQHEATQAANQVYRATIEQYRLAQGDERLRQGQQRIDKPRAGKAGAGGSGGGASASAKPMDETAQRAIDIQAWNYINKGVLPYRKGTGGGADRNDAVVRNAAKIAGELGLTPEEIASKPATWKADAASKLTQTRKLDAIEGQLNSFHNNLNTWDSLAKGQLPKIGGERVKALASDLKKVDYTGIRSVDEMKMRIEQHFNDPTMSAIAVAAMAAAMDYARIMQGPQSIASLTEGARKDAERLIAASADEKGRKGIMAALESDTEGQVRGIREQLAKIDDRLTGKARAKPSSGPEVGKVEGGYRFKGGDPASPASWEKV